MYFFYYLYILVVHSNWRFILTYLAYCKLVFIIIYILLLQLPLLQLLLLIIIISTATTVIMNYVKNIMKLSYGYKNSSVY